MRLGVGLPSFSSAPHTIPPDRFRRYARLADDAGFAGAWVIEHLGENPNYDTSLLDPLVTLSAVAGETESIPVGTSVLLLPLRQPVMAAKRAATLQHLAGRRLTLGLGTGYVESEFDAVGVPMAERSERYLEAIELLERLFSGGEVSFDGEFYSLEGFRLEPELDQPPRILAGGGGVDVDGDRRVHERVKRRLDHADGWIAAPRPPSVLEADWAALAEYLESRGRDPDRADRVALQYLHLSTDDDPDRARRVQRKAYDTLVGADRSVDRAMDRWLTGTVEEVRSTLAEFERGGFDEVILYPTADEPAELERQLRLYERFLLSEFP